MRGSHAMKIDNRTRLPTRLLRTLICRAHANQRKYEGRLPSWDWVAITVRRRLNGTHTSGHAYLSGRAAVLTLPCPRCTARQAYRLIWHEMRHLYGYEHRKMGAYYPPDEETSAACEGLPQVLEEEQPKAKRIVDKQTRELQRVEAGIKRWEGKRRRAENALKKLSRRRAYYARVISRREAVSGASHADNA